MMNLIGCGRKPSWPNLRYYPGICLEGLRKATNIGQDIRSSGRDLYSGPAEYETGMLTTRIRRLVINSKTSNSNNKINIRM
jgi:hypothetical protein